MSVIAQFNQLGGKSVTRLDLDNLRTLAQNEQEFAVYNRITKLLESHPNIEIFEIEPIDNPIQINIGLGAPSIDDLEIKKENNKTIYLLQGKEVAEINKNGVIQWHQKGLGAQIRNKIRAKAHRGLGAPRHSGVAKDGLDECGRLQPGYKFDGSRVIKVGQAAKRKPVVNNRKSETKKTVGDSIFRKGNILKSQHTDLTVLVIENSEKNSNYFKGKVLKMSNDGNVANHKVGVISDFLNSNSMWFPITKKQLTQITKKPIVKNKKNNDFVGYMLLDTISGEMVASKKTLPELQKVYNELEKNEKLDTGEVFVYEINKVDGKNKQGNRILVDWIKEKTNTPKFKIGDIVIIDSPQLPKKVISYRLNRNKKFIYKVIDLTNNEISDLFENDIKLAPKKKIEIDDNFEKEVEFQESFKKYFTPIFKAKFNKIFDFKYRNMYSLEAKNFIQKHIDIFNSKNVTKASKNVTKPTINVIKKVDSGIKFIPLSTITIDRKRFQNRNKLNEVVLKNIVDNFNETELDPLIVWEFKNKTYLLAGHHRYEALTQLKKKTAPVKYFQGSEAAAIDFAKVKSNSNRSLETPLERANLYREMFAKKSKSEVNEQAKKIEGKNANYILNLAALNPKGEVINAVESLIETTDKQNATLVEKLADWIGQARRSYDQLTNAHEREMFLFLMDKEQSKRVKTKADFLQKIYTIVGAFDFEKSNPLNLKRIQYKSEGENTYDQEYTQVKAELDIIYTEYSKLSTRLVDSSAVDFISPADEEIYTNAIKRKAELKKQMQFWQSKQMNLERNKANYARGGQNQIGLFSPMPYLSNDVEEVPTHENGIPTELVDLSRNIKKDLNKNSLAYRRQNRDFTEHEFYKIENQDLAKLLGKIEKKKKESVAITLAGGQGSGKTSFLFQMIEEFAKNYKVGHASCEEHPESALYEEKADKYWSEKTIQSVDAPEIKSLQDVYDLIERNEVIFIDSFSKLQTFDRKITLDDNFRKKFNGKLLIIIYQLTTGNTMRGGSSSQFDGDVILFVEKFPSFEENYVYNDKNRYNSIPLDQLKLNISSGKLIQTGLEQSEQQQEEELEFSNEIEKI